MIQVTFLLLADIRWGVALMLMQYTLGKPHRALAILYILILLNGILAPYKDSKQLGAKTRFKEWIEKLIAYTAFIIVGNIIDMLVVDNMFGWEGSTQFLVCLYLAAKEIRFVLDYLSSRYGIRIPILDERLKQLDQGSQAPPEATKQLQQLSHGIQQLEEKMKPSAHGSKEEQ